MQTDRLQERRSAAGALADAETVITQLPTRSRTPTRPQLCEVSDRHHHGAGVYRCANRVVGRPPVGHPVAGVPPSWFDRGMSEQRRPGDLADVRLIEVDGVSPTIHETAFIAPGVTLIGDVTVGARSSVFYGSVLRAERAKIVIGEDTSVDASPPEASRESRRFDSARGPSTMPIISGASGTP